MNLDRSLDDILKESSLHSLTLLISDKGREPSRGRRRGGHGRGNSFRSAPYQVQVFNTFMDDADLQRRVSANAIPTGPRADPTSNWKHDLYKTVNKTTNGKDNAFGKSKGEEVIQFPPRKYTEQEKAQVLSSGN